MEVCDSIIEVCLAFISKISAERELWKASVVGAVDDWEAVWDYEKEK